MGAMENKGLNLFNTKYVLASPATATDTDYALIESVVGHEYFHNWTGNRVTCRDWFQLSLKEGLTVFRDQEFSQDMAGSTVGRRAPSSASTTCASCASKQFPEDAGPMSHPVRPDSYVSDRQLLHDDRVREGLRSRPHDADAGRTRTASSAALDEYFHRHDGQAVSCDDFVAGDRRIGVLGRAAQRRRPAGSSGAGIQPGGHAPKLTASDDYDAATRRYTLTLSTVLSARGRREVAPVIEQAAVPHPVAPSRLVDARRPAAVPLALDGDAEAAPTRHADPRPRRTTKPRFTLRRRAGRRPVPSLLRDFSAPVIVDYRPTPTPTASRSSLAHDDRPVQSLGGRSAARDCRELIAAHRRRRRTACSMVATALR